MSFLKPINKAVLRFSSTEANAPQINYNSRVAGDVKAVLKACLVTGYGTKESAGWSIVNEVNHVAEFISPEAAMGNYKLGINDTSTSSTSWYYKYQDVQVSVSGSSIAKTPSYINKTNPNNRWDLLVTDRGLYFIETIYNGFVSDGEVARITYWGQCKEAIQNSDTNISFWTTGIGSGENPYYFYYTPSYSYYKVGSYTSITFSSATINSFKERDAVFNASLVDMVSELYLFSNNVLVGQHPGIMLKTVNLESDLYGVTDTTINGRPAIKVCLGADVTSHDRLKKAARTVVVYLDTWEY